MIKILDKIKHIKYINNGFKNLLRRAHIMDCIDEEVKKTYEWLNGEGKDYMRKIKILANATCYESDK